jgi:hypothetical protein
MVDDGGQAFPSGNPTHGGETGMSLRDYLAAHCPMTMAEYVVVYGFPTLKDLFYSDNAAKQLKKFFWLFAEYRYEYADAMIEERKQADAE